MRKTVDRIIEIYAAACTTSLRKKVDRLKALQEALSLIYSINNLPVLEYLIEFILGEVQNTNVNKILTP